MNVEKEKLLCSRVDKEVYYCVSILVSELVSTGKYTEGLLDVCYGENDKEALEHWLVSNWLADRLMDKGEMVVKDFYGLTIWGRSTSGQAIFLDCVIQEIFQDQADWLNEI